MRKFSSKSEEDYDRLCHDFVCVVCALTQTIKNSHDFKEPVDENFLTLSEKIADEIILKWHELRESILNKEI